MRHLVIATRNLHKVREIETILAGFCVLQSLRDYPGAPAAVEDAPTFAGNAVKKAVVLARWLAAQPSAGAGNNLFALADDSGLETDALGGAPGVHSARFAATDKDSGNSPDSANNARLLKLLAETPTSLRTARFRCVLALTPVPSPAPGSASFDWEGQTRLFEGACEGRIAYAPSGTGGFGYDPLFVPDGFEKSLAELGEEVKNTLSHRARALAGLKEHFQRCG